MRALRLGWFLSFGFVVAAAGAAAAPTRVALIGLHGGVFDSLREFAPRLDVDFTYVTDQQLEKGDVDLAPFDLVLIEHVRGEAAASYRKAFESAHARNPQLHVLSISGFASRSFPDLVKSGFIVADSGIDPYYGNSTENLRRFLVYVLAKHAGRALAIEPPVEVPLEGLYHPDHDGLFPDVDSFVRFAKERGADVDHAPRAAVAVHLTHLTFQQPKVVDALIREFEKRGVLAVAIVDQVPSYETHALAFKPGVVVHTCHSKDEVAFREKLGVPQMHSVFFRNQSIADWETSTVGLAANELNLHLVTQELIGGIEPIAAAGTVEGGGSAESFVPIPERVEHLVARACRWIALQRKPEAEKKVAFLYWDREMGKSELMRGSATGMFLNAPRSLVDVLKRMKDAGYRVDPLPKDEDELLAPMLDHGRQIGVYAPGELDRLARSGKAVLVPVESYRRWFEAKVPERERAAVVARWGEPPGDFLSWRDDAGAQFIVIPRVDFGNVVLLPQPLRGEASDSSLVHDRTVPPPHNYLCTYFWIQEQFGADAYVHFGTHGSEIALPGKDTGLSEHDWCDIVIGDLPNVYPWVQNNLGESSIARRRTNAVLIDHLVPPSVTAGLSDELANLDGDLTKWRSLEAGPLRERFQRAITRQCREQHLDRDLHLELKDDDVLGLEQIAKLETYLHDIEEEKTNVDLHVFGRAPPEALRDPYLVTCLRERFLDEIAAHFDVPASEPRDRFLRDKAEQAVRSFVREGLRRPTSRSSPPAAASPSVASTRHWQRTSRSPSRSTTASRARRRSWTACSPRSPAASSRPGRATPPTATRPPSRPVATCT